MRNQVIQIFGDPIPTQLLSLAKAVDAAINEAVESVPEVAQLRVDLKNARERLQSLHEEKCDEMFLHPRNLGSHYYPGIGDGGQLLFTSDCKYCGCWMGGCRSGGPEGVDAKGHCTGNPKLRAAYELLKLRSQVAS
jgi:hypothetical protein